jgi:hypothetical protein
LGEAVTMQVLIPIRTWSEPNLRGHWAKRARRARGQREAARILVRAALAASAGKPPLEGNLRLAIRLTRVAMRQMDSDNLAAGLKAVRDGVSDALQMNDGDRRLDWQYAQQKGKRGEYAVLVTIQEESACLIP